LKAKNKGKEGKFFMMIIIMLAMMGIGLMIKDKDMENY